MRVEVKALGAIVRNIQERGATKAELAALATRADLETLRVEIMGVRVEITERETHFIKWLVGTGVAIAGVIIAATGVLLAVLPRLIR